MTVPGTPAPGVVDRRHRPLRDLRVSVTDRCNFRCPYCMPREVFGPGYAFVERSKLLDFDEIVRVVRVAAGLGVNKVRLTGGEPLLRRDLPRLVGMLAAVEGIDDLAMTTNGLLLAEHAGDLAAAGLRRVTVSLDALHQPTFEAMSDTRQPVARVLEGLAAARDAGLDPVKINTVVRRSANEDQVVPLAEYARDRGYTRFIEYMDVGSTNGWAIDEVVPSGDIVERISRRFPVEPVAAETPGQVATTYRYLDGAGTFGTISSVTRPFCGDCVRARLSPVGELFTCLLAVKGYDLRALLRTGVNDAEFAASVSVVWRGRDDRYSERRSAQQPGDGRVEMSYIGG